MSTSFVDEYLVKLGSSVDQSGLNRFHQALREAAAVSSASATSIAESFFKAQVEITAGFVAIGSAAVGLVDKVAMADQSYRLLAMHMYISKDAARGLKVAMDALGEPLENLTFDAELRDRARQLLEDQREMAPDGDFEGQMKKIRDIRFEFTRMEVESEYLAMHVVEDFMKALGVGPDELLTKLRSINKQIIEDLPRISKILVTDFMPVWKDVEHVFDGTKDAAMDATSTMLMFVGALTNDDKLKDGKVNLENIALAFQHIADGATATLDAMLAVEKFGMAQAKGVTKEGSGIAEALAGATDYLDEKSGLTSTRESGRHFANAKASLDKAFQFTMYGGDTELDKYKFNKAVGLPATLTNASVHALIDQYSSSIGVDAAIPHAIAMHESDERQFDKFGVPMKNPSSTATGVFQLTNATASTVGVDSHDLEGNVEGGVKLFNMMLKKFQGNEAEAIGGYQIGGHAMDNILHHKAALAPGDLLNIKQVLQGAGKSGDFNVGDIIIHIDKPGQTNEKVGHEVASRLRGMQVQRNLAEANPWGQ